MHRFEHPDTAETRLAKSIFLVEADSFAQHQLWAQHSGQSLYPNWDTRKNQRAYEPLKWEQVGNGWIVTTGTSGRGKKARPINISLNWAWIEGQLVTFWYACSQVVDHVVVEKWLKENFKAKYDNGTRSATCDAMNFGHCLSAIREANKQK
jgi:hypothetical protein